MMITPLSFDSILCLNTVNTYNKAENMCFISVSLYSASCLAPIAPLL